MTAPEVGDIAPDAVLMDPDGRDVQLSASWADQPAVVVFLRYFGCPFCQAQVVTLRRDEAMFREAGARVVLVGHGNHDDALAFVQAKRLPFPLLLDLEREAYRAYGLMQGKVMQVLSPRSALPWIRAELSPETRQRGLKGGSFMQMPGTFVIDTGGVVRFTGGLIQFAHRNKHVADSPTNDLILRVLASLVGRARDEIALAGEGGPDPQPDPA
jgi:prostamide/prostaglandin F2alpha synthase